MKCPKCGMFQRAKPLCEACGAATGRQGRTFAPPPPVPEAPDVLSTPESPAQPPAFDPVPSSPGQAPESDSHEIHRLHFHGTGRALFVIFVMNIFRTLLTLGIYHFWGKVKIRQFLWSETEFKTDRLAYHGTGRELLIGSIKASFLIGSVYLLREGVNFLTRSGEMAFIEFFGKIAYAAIFLAFVAAAVAGSYRYRLSRTSWRGVHFSFRGNIREYVEIFFSGVCLTFLTFGFYYPVFVARQNAFLINHTWFGDHAFDFTGRGKELMKPSLPLLLCLHALVIDVIVFIFLAVFASNQFGSGKGGETFDLLLSNYSVALPLVMLIGFFLLFGFIPLSIVHFLAASKKFTADYTTFGKARFHSNITGPGLLRLYMGNLFLFVLSAGLAYPWVLVRNHRFIYQNMNATGPLLLEEVHRAEHEASTTGEGIGGFLDVDSGLGVS